MAGVPWQVSEFMQVATSLKPVQALRHCYTSANAIAELISHREMQQGATSLWIVASSLIVVRLGNDRCDKYGANNMCSIGSCRRDVYLIGDEQRDGELDDAICDEDKGMTLACWDEYIRTAKYSDADFIAFLESGLFPECCSPYSLVEGA